MNAPAYYVWMNHADENIGHQTTSPRLDNGTWLSKVLTQGNMTDEINIQNKGKKEMFNIIKTTTTAAISYVDPVSMLWT